MGPSGDIIRAEHPRDRRGANVLGELNSPWWHLPGAAGQRHSAEMTRLGDPEDENAPGIPEHGDARDEPSAAGSKGTFKSHEWDRGLRDRNTEDMEDGQDVRVKNLPRPGKCEPGPSQEAEPEHSGRNSQVVGCRENSLLSYSGADCPLPAQFLMQNLHNGLLQVCWEWLVEEWPLRAWLISPDRGKSN